MGVLLRAAFLAVAAFAAWALWLGEVCWVKGWAGLAWLDGFNWSALPICAVIVATASYAVSPDAAWPARVKFVRAGFVLATGGFVAGRWAIFEMSRQWATDYRPLAVLAVAGLAVPPASPRRPEGGLRRSMSERQLPSPSR